MREEQLKATVEVSNARYPAGYPFLTFAASQRHAETQLAAAQQKASFSFAMTTMHKAKSSKDLGRKFQGPKSVPSRH